MEGGTPTSMASHHCAARGVAWLGRDALGKTRAETGGLETAWGSRQSRGEGDSPESPGRLPPWPCPSVHPRAPQTEAAALGRELPALLASLAPQAALLDNNQSPQVVLSREGGVVVERMGGTRGPF